MTAGYAFVGAYIINSPVIHHKRWFSLIKVHLSYISAKKSTQYAESSLTHMIDIFLCPDQDLYFSALEGKTKTVHP
jgi:hypothetical protein